MKRSGTISTYQLCLVAMAVAVNIAGGQIALLLRLPVYLDSIGTILVGAVLGPWMGMIPNLLSGIFMGMTVDVYSLYFAPVGMVTGLMSGLLMGRGPVKGPGLFLTALGVAIPGTLVSSLINAVLFGGVTSSGSAPGADGKHFRGADSDGLRRPLHFHLRRQRPCPSGRGTAAGESYGKMRRGRQKGRQTGKADKENRKRKTEHGTLQ